MTSADITILDIIGLMVGAYIIIYLIFSKPLPNEWGKK